MTSGSAQSELNDRDRRILAALVREYIDHGEAVSSLWLASLGRFGVSSATLRNILAHLEDLGYVRQPHTSAGRVPTDLGYRCYVDMLVRARRAPKEAPALEARLRRGVTIEDVLASVSLELSRASQHVGFALAPEPGAATLRRLDLVPLEATRILVIVVTTGGVIVQKAVDIGERLTATELTQAANYLNAEFAGLPLVEIRNSIARRLHQDRVLYDALLARALRLAQTSLEWIARETPIFVQGASSLLSDAAVEEDRLSLGTLRSLFRMIEEKDRLLRVLDGYLDEAGLTVVIGTEHTSPDLQHFSLVASTFEDGGRLGAIGIIGPTRMRYSRAIAAVDTLARAVGRVLETN
jgi:heat-inducible transcriptional repressor